MITLKNISVTYENNLSRKVIDDFNMSIGNGEIFAVIGESGAGKSTLIKVIAGINDDYDGEVYVNGELLNTKRQKIGYIPQNYGLIPWKTVKENILLPSIIKYGKHGMDYESYSFLIKSLKIMDIQNRYPKDLSGGEAQRVAIARAFLLKPDVLLMDEPFSALDAITREQVQNLFLKVWKEYKVTTIIVTHDINEAMFLGNKIKVISKARGNYKPVANPYFGRKIGNTDEGFISNINYMLRGESYD